jgi:hypothetical protein
VKALLGLHLHLAYSTLLATVFSKNRQARPNCRSVMNACQTCDLFFDGE